MFEFNFRWNGKITTEKGIPGIPTYEESTQRKVDVDYGKDIIEMKYFDEKIDYKANFD